MNSSLDLNQSQHLAIKDNTLNVDRNSQKMTMDERLAIFDVKQHSGEFAASECLGQEKIF